MDIGNYERIDREERQRSTPPEIAAAPAFFDERRAAGKERSGKLTIVFLLQTLFALFVTAAIVLASGGYLGEAPETLPNDVAEDAATRALSSLCRRWFGDADGSGIFDFGSARQSQNGGEKQETSDETAGESATDGEEAEEAPRAEKLGLGVRYTALYSRSAARAGLSGALAVPASVTLAPVATTARAESPITGWDETTVNSGFGYRTHPITGKLDFHTGLDIPAGYGEAVRAVFPGVVAEIGYSDIFGNYVVLEHTSGTRTRYCHCSSVAVEEGARVRAGETVAYVGSTGVSTGAHLHLDLIVNGLYSDPKWLFLTPFSSAE